MSEVQGFRFETQADGKVDKDQSVLKLQEVLNKKQFWVEELQKMSPDFRQKVMENHLRLSKDVQNMLNSVTSNTTREELQRVEASINQRLGSTILEQKVLRGGLISVKEVGMPFRTVMWSESQKEHAISDLMVLEGEDALRLMEAKRQGWTLVDSQAMSQRILTFYDAQGKEVSWTNIGQAGGWKKAIQELLEISFDKKNIDIKSKYEKLLFRTQFFTFETRADGSMTEEEIKRSGEKLQKVVEEMQAELPVLKGMSEGELRKNFTNYFRVTDAINLFLWNKGDSSKTVYKKLKENPIFENWNSYRWNFKTTITSSILDAWLEIDKYKQNK